MELALSIAFSAALAATCAWPAPAPGSPPIPKLAESPWNGDWVLSRACNPRVIQEAAAEGYRFHLGGDGSIRWEIPSLHEVVVGRMDGAPTAIHRPGASGLALSVRAAGPWTLVLANAGARRAKAA